MHLIVRWLFVFIFSAVMFARCAAFGEPLWLSLAFAALCLWGYAGILAAGLDHDESLAPRS